MDLFHPILFQCSHVDMFSVFGFFFFLNSLRLWLCPFKEDEKLRMHLFFYPVQYFRNVFFSILIRSSLHVLCSLGISTLVMQHDNLSCSHTHTHTFTCSFIHAPVHIWEIESTHILSSVGSNVPLPVSQPGGTSDSGPVHPRNFCYRLFPFLPLLCYIATLPCAIYVTLPYLRLLCVAPPRVCLCFVVLHLDAR